MTALPVTCPRPLTPACSHDEFSPLKEIVVGDVAGARLHPRPPTGQRG
jgi:hypothetical protein